MTLADDIQRIRGLIERASAEHARREAERQIAQKLLQDHERTIQSEFGIDPAELPAEITRLEAALREEVCRISSFLDEVGA